MATGINNSWMMTHLRYKCGENSSLCPSQPINEEDDKEVKNDEEENESQDQNSDKDKFERKER